LGYDGKPDFAFLNIKDRVRSLALCEYSLLFCNRHNLPAIANGREEGYGIELSVFLMTY
jgi:hypothetical protein